MPKKCNNLLARVNFPIFCVQSLTNRYVLVAGGGGGAKTGIRNVIEIYELINNGSTCRAVPVHHYETGNEAIMNCTIFNAGKYFILFAGMEGNCRLYKIRQEVVETEDPQESKMEDGTSVRRRNLEPNSEGENQLPPRKESLTKLQFDIQPLETFQTDFSDEPFQKLVRFSSVQKMLITAGADGHMRMWKYPKMNKILDIAAHSDDVDDLDICPEGKTVVSVSRDGHGKVWDTEDGELITELEYKLPVSDNLEGKYIFRSCRFGVVSDKNDMALFGTLNPAVRKKPPLKSYLLKWDTKRFSLEKIVSTGSDMLSTMAISDNGHFIGLGTQSGSVKMYIAFSLQLLYNVDNIHNIFVTGLSFLPTSEESRRITGGHEASLVSVSVDNHIIIHHIPVRASMSLLTLLTLFMFALLLVFVIMDFFNL